MQMEQRRRCCSPVKAEGGHADSQGVAMEHQGTGAHPWLASAQSEMALGGAATHTDGGDRSGSNGNKLQVAA